MSKLKVAMLSRWHVHAPGYARELQAMDEAEITAVWDHDPAAGTAWAAELGVPFYADLDQVLALPDLDGVVVNTATNLHPEVMVAAASAGKHIFTEKVMALTVEGAERIAAAVRQADVRFCISYPHRTMPDRLFAKQAVAEGWLGEVNLLRIRNAHGGAVRDWLPAHFYDPEACGGGALIDLGAHPMYLARWLMGEPRRISAMLNSITGRPVDDNAVVTIEFANKGLAIIETGFVSEQSPFALELYGSEGTLLVGGNRPGVQVVSNKLAGTVPGWIAPSRLPKPLPSPLRQWVRGIVAAETIHFGLEEGIQLTEMMAAAMQSHREGRVVEFA